MEHFNLDSLGFTVIKTLTKQINGKLEEIKKQGNLQNL